MRISTLKPAPLLLTLALAACGGGGGGSDSSGGSTSPSAAPVDLTAANMETAGSTSVTAADVGSAPPADIGDFLTGAQAAARGPAGSAIQRVLEASLQAFVGASADDAASGITLTRTEACSQSGNVALTIEDNNNGQIDAGDALTAQFNACDNGEGVIDGRLSLDLTSLSGDFSPNGSASGNARLTELKITSEGASVTATGAMGISLQQDASSLVIEYRSTNVRYTLAGPLRQGTLTVVDGVSTVSQTPTGTATTLTQSISADFPRFSGAIDIATTTPIVTATGGEIQSGGLAVSGSNGRLTLSFLGGGQVQLELDANDDGTAEVSRSAVLAELEVTAF
ncbi:MAG: hypothetical protein KDG55_06870 [Rhodocyclaceae bacterium]|nr:hypothetical protein [Rhodocyclaceae bacterium]